MEDVDDKVLMDDQEGCRTPERDDCRIPAMNYPPPPPRKKRFDYFGRGGGKGAPPKNGYFHSPEIDVFFAVPATRQVAMAHLME